MPAVWPTNTAHDADAPQTAEELIEICLRDLLAGGDLGALHRTLPEASGKLDHGVSPVVAAHGQSQSKVIPSTL
jgi:hypothetical protein